MFLYKCGFKFKAQNVCFALFFGAGERALMLLGYLYWLLIFEKHQKSTHHLQNRIALNYSIIIRNGTGLHLENDIMYERLRKQIQMSFI